METTLCFDFGNTRLKCAIFEDDRHKETITLENGEPGTIIKIVRQYDAIYSILASVIDHSSEIETILARETGFHKLSYQSKLPFTTPVGKPETIGADRLALAAAATLLNPGRHSLVIGLGTCVTFNFINKFHEFLGGSISPGLEMRFKAMHQFTAKLPLVKPDGNFPLTGYDTKTNLQSGAIMGITKEIDGIIDEYALKYSNFNAFLTGGDMGFFVPHLKNKIFADPQLIYKGLYAINKINQV